MASDGYLDDLLALSVLVKRKKTNKRKIWTKDWLLQRHVFTHTNLLEELRYFPEDFNNFLRMDEETYLLLFETVSPFIEK